MTVCTAQNSPILEPLIYGLLAASYPLLYSSSSRIRLHTARAFHVGWGGALVPPIRLAPLPWLQHINQTIPEDSHVIPFSGRVWPTPPADAPSLDAEPYLVPQPALLEFVAPEGLRIALRNPKVSPIDRQQTILPDITHQSVLKLDLLGQGMKDELQWFNK